MTIRDLSVAQLGKMVHETFVKDGKEKYDALLDQIAAERGQDIVVAVLDEAQLRAGFEMAEAKAEYEYAHQLCAFAEEIFEGLPKGTQFEKALRI